MKKKKQNLSYFYNVLICFIRMNLKLEEDLLWSSLVHQKSQHKKTDFKNLECRNRAISYYWTKRSEQNYLFRKVSFCCTNCYNSLCQSAHILLFSFLFFSLVFCSSLNDKDSFFFFPLISLWDYFHPKMKFWGIFQSTLWPTVNK